MKVCVLLPDYSTTKVDYQYYDPPRLLNELLPEDEVDTVFLNKLTTYQQLKQLSHKGYDIFVNLCEGYLEWEVPSSDVPYTLELLNLPFTGPGTLLYDPPKALMKYVAYCSNVPAPAYALVKKEDDINQSISSLQFPLFVKPAKSGDSLGIDDHSLVHTLPELQQKLQDSFLLFDEMLVEEYISGREFTVLVAANADGSTCRSFKPVEYIFPEGFAFKTYALKTSELHPNSNIPCNDPQLENALRSAAENIFTAFNGQGYARLDFRVAPDGRIYFLEINFTCSVFYKDGYEGSADFIVKFDGIGQQGFLQHIIAEGISRYRRKQKKYIVKVNALAGYGVYASKDIAEGEVIFYGEGKPHRIITKQYVAQHWNEAQQLDFKRYAYPIGNDVYVLWDNDPAEWAPQNHSCEANTGYSGLNVIALRKINKHEELTLDYAKFLDDSMMPFTCDCKAPRCRGVIQGQPGNHAFGRQ